MGPWEQAVSGPRARTLASAEPALEQVAAGQGSCIEGPK